MALVKAIWLLGAGLLAVAGIGAGVLAQKKYTIITVVKITGVNWFNRMEEGVNQYAKDSGNSAYGAHLNERLAKCMGNEGKWSVFVGSLGSKTHNQWADGGINNAKKYAKLQLVEAKQESNDDAERAYEKAKEILKKYPDIKGFQGSSSLDVVGIGRAIDGAGL